MAAKLSAAQKRLLLRDGYVVLPGLVPRAMTDAVLREINVALGTGTALRDHSASPAALALYHGTPIAAIVDSLLGAGKAAPCTQAQIALRFPVRSDDEPDVVDAHVDGLMANEAIGRFTLTVGVLLSDTPKPSMGNFKVYPGTHRRVARYVQEHGLEAAPGLAWKLELPAPAQITGRAGDAILCHHQLVHGRTLNRSPRIRYMAFFRVYHDDAWNDKSAAYIKKALTEPWLEWPAMRGLHGA
jgi:hypothetical protein